MKRGVLLLLCAALLVPLSRASSLPIDIRTGKTSRAAVPARNDLAVIVDVTGEPGDVFESGSAINVSFRVSRDAYVVVYNVDSEGYVHLLHPMDGKPVLSEARTTYFLPEPGSGIVWETGGKTGIEYIHAVAVEDASLLNEDELYFLSRSERMADEKRLRIDMDPGLAFNMIDEEIVRDAARNAPATDFARFYINRRVDFPRYLCAKCHSPEKISDPYAEECPETVIEPSGDDGSAGYPYAELYDVRESHGRNDEAYSSLDENDEEDAPYDDVDTHIYLSFGYSAYDPWYAYSWYGWGWGWQWWWDPFWWGVGWGWPYYYGWGYYPWWRDPWYGCGWCGGGYWHDRHDHLRYRPVYGERSVTKRLVDYQRTSRELARERSIDHTRLARAKASESERRLERSDLRRQATLRGRSDLRGQTIERERSGGAMIRGERSSSRGKSDLERQIERPADRSRRESTGPSRTGTRDDRAIDRKTTRTSRDMQRREATRAAERSKSSGERGRTPSVQPSRPDRGSGNTRSSSPPSRSSSPPSKSGSSSGSGSSHGSGGGKTRTR